MSLSQSLDVGKDVQIQPASKDRVKEYDEAREEISSIPTVEFEKPKNNKELEKPKPKEIHSVIYVLILFAIIAVAAWLFYKPSVVSEKNITVLAELLKQGLV